MLRRLSPQQVRQAVCEVEVDHASCTPIRLSGPGSRMVKIIFNVMHSCHVLESSLVVCGLCAGYYVADGL
jgi:hypothetical protein